jgi:hypothetical protein
MRSTSLIHLGKMGAKWTGIYCSLAYHARRWGNGKQELIRLLTCCPANFMS